MDVDAKVGWRTPPYLTHVNYRLRQGGWLVLNRVRRHLTEHEDASHVFYSLSDGLAT